MAEHRVSRNLAVVALASAVAMTTASAWGSYKGSFYQPPVSSTHNVTSYGVTGSALGLPVSMGLPAELGAVAGEETFQADRTWNNAAGGAWNTAGNWTGGVPTAADQALFTLNSTYTVTVPAGAVANNVRQTAGNVTLTGGTLTTDDLGNPGVGNPAPPAVASLVVAGAGQMTITGGQQFTYVNGYVGEAVANTSSLSITGAGTVVRTPPASAEDLGYGRFGILAGNATLNVSNGGTLAARLFEFGRQDGAYTATVNVNGGTLTTSGHSDDQSYPQIVLPRGAGATLNFNVSNGGQVNAATLFSGAETNPNTGTLNVSGANSLVRVANVAVVNGGGDGTPGLGTTTFNVTSGTLSVGRINSNQNGGTENNLTSALANYNVTGSTAKLEVKDSNGFDQSYIAMGFGQWSTDTINVTAGGDVVVTDTGTTESDGATLQMAISSHTRSTLNVDGAGSTFAVDDQISLAAVDQDSLTGLYGEDAIGTINVRNGGSVTVTEGNAFFATDPGNQANLNVETGGTYLVNGQWTLGGGNGDGFDFVGSGNSTVSVSGGGTATAQMMIIHQDDGDSSIPVAQTSITISGANSKVEVNGEDDPFTEGLDGGFISAGGTFSNTVVNINSGGQMKARYFANFGESDDSTTAVTVTGVGSVLDAGGQLAIGGTNNNTATLTVADGAVAKAVVVDEEDVDLLGIMFLGAEAGNNSTVTVNLNNSLGGPNPAQTMLDAAGIIWVGGIFGGDPAELTLGVPTTITGQANTQIRYGIELYLAPNSSITTAGTFQYTGPLTDFAGTFLDGPATITGAGVSHMGVLGIDNSDAEFNGKLTLNAATGHAVAAVTRLDLGGGAKLDLRRSDALVIHPTTFGTEPDTLPAQTLADIKPLIVAGYAGGTWNPAETVDAIVGGDIAGQNPKRGIGYRVATAAGDFLGEPIAVGDILVRNTLLGDANLSGNVDFNDLLALAQNYLTTNPANREWFHGNFNYDNAVNFDDLLVTAQNYGGALTLEGDLAMDWGMNSSFDAQWALALNSVPEPTTLGALAGVGLLALRRRKH